MRMTASKGIRPHEADGLEGGHLPDGDVRVHERGRAGGDHDVGVGDEVEAPPTQMPLTAEMTGFQTSLERDVIPFGLPVVSVWRPLATRLPIPPASATSFTSTPVWKARPGRC